MKAWIQKYNKKYNANLTIRFIEKWGFYEDLGMSVEECFVIFNQAWADIDNLESIEQDIWQKTKMLSNLGTVDIVTSVYPEQAAKVKEWLDRQGVVRNKIVFTQDKTILEYDVFIDDSPSNIVKVVQNGKIGLLYNQPWNRQVDVQQDIFTGQGQIFRVYNLYDAIDMIRSLKKTNVLC